MIYYARTLSKREKLVFFQVIAGVLMIFTLFTLSNIAFAQTLHARTLYETVNQTSGTNEIAHIDTGQLPLSISIDEGTNRFYVLTKPLSGNPVISVYSGEDNMQVGNDIEVGYDARAIAVDDATHAIYVANSLSNSVSVISGENYTKIGEDIQLG
jgi:DNA-binding beta-propeller fold protein YncE